MELKKILEKLTEEKKAFSHYSQMDEKQRLAYLFYHVYMNKYILNPEDKWARKNALHFLNRYKKLTLEK